MFFRCAVVVLSVGLSALVALWSRPFAYHSPHLFFYSAILISLLYGGLGPGIASTIFSAALINFLFLPPYGHFSFDLLNFVHAAYFCISFGLICWFIDARREPFEGQTEEQLRESEEGFRLFVEHAPAALAMFDREMRYLHVSRRWRTDFGLGDRDLRGVSHYDVFPEIPERWREAHRRGLAGEVVQKENDRFERADGSVHWVEWEIRPWRDRRGAVGGIVLFTQDITERRQAEQLFRKSEEDYRTLFDSMDEAFCTIEVLFDENNDPVDYRFLEVNPAFERQTGIKDGRGKTMREIAPQHEEHWFATYGKIAMTGEPARFENVAAQLGRSYDVHAFRVGDPQERKVAIFFNDITERKRWEGELARSRQALEDKTLLLQSVLDSMSEGLVAADEQGKFILWNPAAEKIVGLGPADMPSQEWSKHYGVYLPDQATPFPVELNPLARAIRGELASAVMFLRHPELPNGAFVEAYASPLKDKHGIVRGGVTAFRDITERMKTEERLREYERVVEGLEEMIFVVDRQYRYVLANRAFLTFSGMPAEQVVGHLAAQVVGEDVFVKLIKEQMDECFLTGKVVQYQVTYPLPNRRKRELFASYFPIEGSSGVDRIACVLQDITDRNLAEEALRKSEERFSKAFRSSPLAITISTQAEGRYLDVNEAFLHMLGYERHDVIGYTSADLRFWSEPSERVEMVRQMKEKTRVAKHHTRYRTATGEVREAEVWAESVELDGRECVLAITADVTEVRRLEAQFRQAQKMEAVGRLAGGVAHDFNNLLGVIIGYSDLSMSFTPRQSPMARYLSEIKKASQRAASLTQQLLAFSRRQVVFPKILDLNEVVQNATNMFRRLVGEDISVEFRPTTPIDSIQADLGQIEQILMNLVVNARDAMPTGGQILIETTHAELDEHYVSQHPDSPIGQHVVLMVSDTGCGMDENTRSQIFEPFFTTKPVGQGTGLGLSTVYGIVKQSGGYIAVYSEPGHGTTFKIYFPRVLVKAESLAPPPEEVEPPRGSETILVVEDDDALREIAVTLLRGAGYRVISAKDGEHALSIVIAPELHIDLMITDVVMPGKGGVELVAQAKLVHPNLRSLFMSGYTDDLVARHGVLVDEDSFLEKPFTRRSLLTKVYSALHSEPGRRLARQSKSSH